MYRLSSIVRITSVLTLLCSTSVCIRLSLERASRRDFMFTTGSAASLMSIGPNPAVAESPQDPIVDSLKIAPTPTIGIGTCCDPPEIVEQQILDALQSGFRLIDTATHYENEQAIGKALKEAARQGVASREDICLVTKVWFDEMGYDSTAKSVWDSLKRLDVESVDLVLVHFPGTIDAIQSPKANDILRLSTWRALEDAVDAGYTKSIGVSNFNVKHLRSLLPKCRILPSVNQIEYHPYFQQPDLVAFCDKYDMEVMSFCPLANGQLNLLKDTQLSNLAAQYGKTVPQVVLRWLLQEKITPIVKSNDVKHMKDDLGVYDWAIAESDMEILRGLNMNSRVSFNSDLIA